MKGYLKTSGIEDTKYVWVRENHLFKDDYIYISYHGLLKEIISHWRFKDIEDYDVCVSVMILLTSFLQQKSIRGLILQKSELKLKRRESGFGTMNRIIIKLVGLKTEAYLSSG